MKNIEWLGSRVFCVSVIQLYSLVAEGIFRFEGAFGLITTRVQKSISSYFNKGFLVCSKKRFLLCRYCCFCIVVCVSLVVIFGFCCIVVGGSCFVVGSVSGVFSVVSNVLRSSFVCWFFSLYSCSVFFLFS